MNQTDHWREIDQDIEHLNSVQRHRLHQLFTHLEARYVALSDNDKPLFQEFRVLDLERDLSDPEERAVAVMERAYLLWRIARN